MSLFKRNNQTKSKKQLRKEGRIKRYLKGLAVMVLGTTCGFVIINSLPGGISLNDHSAELDSSGYKIDTRYTEDGDRIEPVGKAYVIQIHGGMNVGTSQEFSKQVQFLLPKLRKSDKIVLSVESPGGASIACMNIASDVRDLKNYVDEVISITEFASLSCGYYVSATADKIYASNGAAMGNVGVVMQLPNLTGKRTQTPAVTIGSSRLKEIFGGDGIRNAEDRALVAKSIRRAYLQFGAHVMRNRFSKMTSDLVTGDFFQGKAALKVGAVDEIKSNRRVLLSLHAQNYDIIIVESFGNIINQLTSMKSDKMAFINEIAQSKM